MSFFKNVLNDIYYVGADISSAVDVAALRFLKNNNYCSFIQCDLTKLPFEKNSFDIIFQKEFCITQIIHFMHCLQ